MENEQGQSGILTSEQLIGQTDYPAAVPAADGICPMQQTVCNAWDGLNGECLTGVCFYQGSGAVSNGAA